MMQTSIAVKISDGPNSNVQRRSRCRFALLALLVCIHVERARSPFVTVRLINEATTVAPSPEQRRTDVLFSHGMYNIHVCKQHQRIEHTVAGGPPVAYRRRSDAADSRRCSHCRRYEPPAACAASERAALLAPPLVPLASPRLPSPPPSAHRPPRRRRWKTERLTE